MVKLLAGAVVMLGLNWRRTYFQAHSQGCWLKRAGPHPVGLPYGHLTAWQLASPVARKQESERGQARQKPQSFCNLISGVTSHHFCPIVLEMSQQFQSTHEQRLHAGMDGYLEVGITGALSEASCHSIHTPPWVWLYLDLGTT